MSQPLRATEVRPLPTAAAYDLVMAGLDQAQVCNDEDLPTIRAHVAALELVRDTCLRALERADGSGAHPRWCRASRYSGGCTCWKRAVQRARNLAMGAAG